MKFGADVIHLRADAADCDRVNYPLIDSTNAATAAWRVAQWEGKRKYGDDPNWMAGQVTNQLGKELTFMAQIGVFRASEGKGVCVGHAIEIRLYERGDDPDWMNY